jgi:hypothetical protein
VGQHHINKEMCTVSVVFPLFCLTLIYIWYKNVKEQKNLLKGKPGNVHTMNCFYFSHKLTGLRVKDVLCIVVNVVFGYN